MSDYLNRRLNFRLLISGLIFTVMGIVFIVLSVRSSGSAPVDTKVRELNTVLSGELAAGMSVTGHAVRPIGKFTADLGNGERTYMVVELQTKYEKGELTDKYVSVDLSAMSHHSDEWWDKKIKQERINLKDGRVSAITGDQDMVTVSCTLRSLPSDFSMVKIYNACGANAPANRILRLYGEPYELKGKPGDERSQPLPIWVGFGVLVFGGMFLAFFFTRISRGC